MPIYESDFIDGTWTASTSDELSGLVDPTCEAAIGHVRHSAPEAVDRAVLAASRALARWSAVPPVERAAVLERAMEQVAASADAFVAGMTAEIGVPVWFGRLLQVPMPLKNAAVAIDYVRTMAWGEACGTSLVDKVPMGVVAAITPWNAPLHQIVAKVIAALAAGCTVVLKPSEVVPSTAVLFARALDAAGLPAGAFNMVWGGPAIGAALCRHPLVDMVSFTGSEAVGCAVAEAAGREGKRVVLELGGKSAAILLDDAPLDRAVPGVVTSCLANSGQTCVAQTRLIVPRSRLAEIEALCHEALRGWTLGDPRDEATRLGPQATRSQRDRIRSFIRSGVAEGARLLTGGEEQPAEAVLGFYIRPTIFSDVKPDMRIAREEIFGPVLSIIPVDGIEEAIEVANGIPYGLSGSVWGEQASALAVAQRLWTGQVSLNGAPQNFLAPFGGFRKSGFGRENGRFGVEEFLQLRAIHGAA